MWLLRGALWEAFAVTLPQGPREPWCQSHSVDRSSRGAVVAKEALEQERREQRGRRGLWATCPLRWCPLLRSAWVRAPRSALARGSGCGRSRDGVMRGQPVRVSSSLRINGNGSSAEGWEMTPGAIAVRTGVAPLGLCPQGSPAAEVTACGGWGSLGGAAGTRVAPQALCFCRASTAAAGAEAQEDGRGGRASGPGGTAGPKGERPKGPAQAVGLPRSREPPCASRPWRPLPAPCGSHS